MIRSKPKKSALILSGGGAYGAYEVGVLKALATGFSPSTNYKPLEVDIFSGTSAGSFNATFLASRWQQPLSFATDQLERVWLEQIPGRARFNNGVYRVRLDPLWVLNPRRLRHPLQTLREATADSVYLSLNMLARASYFFSELRREPAMARLLNLIDISALISTDPLLQTIRRSIDFEALQIGSQEVRIVALNWTTGHLEVFGNRELNPRYGPSILRGSSSIPGIFRPQRFGNRYLADGSILAMAPTRSSLEAGAEQLHLIIGYPQFQPNPLVYSLLGAAERTGTITNDQLFQLYFHTLGLASQLRKNCPSNQQDQHQPDGLDSTNFEIVKKILQYSLGCSDLQSYANLEIHLYSAGIISGETPGNIVNFDRWHIRRLINLGFEQAKSHDCEASGCILHSKI